MHGQSRRCWGRSGGLAPGAHAWARTRWPFQPKQRRTSSCTGDVQLDAAPHDVRWPGHAPLYLQASPGLSLLIQQIFCPFQAGIPPRGPAAVLPGVPAIQHQPSLVAGLPVDSRRGGREAGQRLFSSWVRVASRLSWTRST